MTEAIRPVVDADEGCEGSVCSEGSEGSEGFQAFVVERWSRLLRTAYLLTGEQYAAEDLVQGCLERTFVAWRKVSQAQDPDAYVRRIMINLHARKHRRKLKEFLSLSGDPGLGPDLPGRGDDMAQAVERSHLIAALARLPRRQREAVVLRYWEDLSETQTAAAMGCSVGTVKSNAARGITRLRATVGLGDTGRDTHQAMHEGRTS